MAEYIQCKNCKGIGRVASTYMGKRWAICPICNGTGKKIIYKGKKK